MSDIIVRTNLPDFRRQLAAVGDRMEKRYVRRSANAAAGVFRALAREKAPILKSKFNKRKGMNLRFAGALKRGLYVARNRKASRRGIEVYSVKVSGSVRFRSTKSVVGKGKAGGTALPFYWRWQEKGWMPRGGGQRLRGGTRYKKLQRERNRAGGARFIEGRWFLRDSAKEGASAAVDAFFRKMTESFAEESRKK